jgi:hypothetical protein
MNYHENPYDLPGLKAYDLDNEADAFEAQKRSRRCELIKEQIAELQDRIAVLQAMLERERDAAVPPPDENDRIQLHR